MRVKQAIFLVGGRGTRLGSISAHIPKPLLEISPGLRFLDVLIDQAVRHGFTDIILLAGHLGSQVEQLYEGRQIHGAKLSVVRESEPAGTGGALSRIADKLDDWFILANGDSLFDINLRALSNLPQSTIEGRLALRQVPDVSRFGSVELAGDLIVSFKEKTEAGNREGLINGGIYLLSRKIIAYLQPRCSLENDVFPILAEARKLQGKRFDNYFLDIGVPDTFAQAQREILQQMTKPAAFLDRDGVLNVDVGYTHLPGDLVWVEGARETILHFNETGHFVFVVTNQAGIARGLYDAEQMTAFHDRMQEQLADVGAHIDAFYFCPFHHDAVLDAFKVADHPDRKPNAGMILRAMGEWPVDRARSFLIGDKESDLEAARRAKIRGYLFGGGDLRAFTTAAIEKQQFGREA